MSWVGNEDDVVDIEMDEIDQKLEKLLEGPLRRPSQMSTVSNRKRMSSCTKKSGTELTVDYYTNGRSSQEKSRKSQNCRSSQISTRSSTLSVNSQMSQKRKSALRTIRDDSTRIIRKTSIHPDQAFIVEESMLEDLCELSGEEANKGGNIILKDEKEQLLRRISRNPETEAIFSSTKKMREFSLASNTSNVNCSNSGSNYAGRDSWSRGSLPARMSTEPRERSSIGRDPNEHSNSSLGSNEELKNILKARRKSLASITGPNNEIHTLTTHVNYRTEVTALKIAQEEESCSCLRSFLTTCNIYL